MDAKGSSRLAMVLHPLSTVKIPGNIKGGGTKREIDGIHGMVTVSGVPQPDSAFEGTPNPNSVKKNTLQARASFKGKRAANAWKSSIKVDF